MSSPEDWNYKDLGVRLRELVKPPFTVGKSPPGQHCRHCPKDEMETCDTACLTAYRELHGFDPPRE